MDIQKEFDYMILPEGFKFIEYKGGFKIKPDHIKNTYTFVLKGPNGKIKEFEFSLLAIWSAKEIRSTMISLFKEVINNAVKDPYFMVPQENN